MVAAFFCCVALTVGSAAPYDGGPLFVPESDLRSRCVRIR